MTYTVKLPEFDLSPKQFEVLMGRPPKNEAEFHYFGSCYEDLLWHKIHIDQYDEEMIAAETEEWEGNELL
jgi:hypothetical protein